MFVLSLEEILASIGRLTDENNGPEGESVDLVACETSPERFALTSVTELLTIAAAVPKLMSEQNPMGDHRGK